MYKSFSSMILAAGFGKRMLSLTKDLPKPLIQINNVELLKNTIDFLIRIKCNKIVINTHYKHNLIFEFVNKFYKEKNINIIYEKDILDTGGGVKNATNCFKDKDILVVNSDIYLKKENEIDIINFVDNFKSNEKCKLLLIEKDKAHGLININGDFSFNKSHIKRWKSGDRILYYAGIQMISLEILKNFNLSVFSFNDVWDLQIKKNSLYGSLMNSHLYHVGDKNGLKEAINSNT